MLTRIAIVALLLTAIQAEPAKTYTDPTYKYTLTYPGHFQFEMKDGKEGWFIRRHKRGTVDFNPNLNVTLEEIADDGAIKSTADYMKLGMDAFKKSNPDAVIVQEPMECKVDGKDFHKLMCVLPVDTRRIFVVQYSYYSPKFKKAFVWTAVDSTKNPLKDIAALEEIIQTIKFE
jgi:hypothetical protein